MQQLVEKVLLLSICVHRQCPQICVIYDCVHCGFFYCGCGKQPCSNSVSIGFQPFDAVIRNHIDIDHKFVISGLWQTIRFLTLVCSGEAQPSRADCCWESLGGFNTQVRMALHNV